MTLEGGGSETGEGNRLIGGGRGHWCSHRLPQQTKKKLFCSFLLKFSTI